MSAAQSSKQVLGGEQAEGSSGRCRGPPAAPSFASAWVRDHKLQRGAFHTIQLGKTDLNIIYFLSEELACCVCMCVRVCACVRSSLHSTYSVLV